MKVESEWILTINELPKADDSYFGEWYIVCDTIGQVMPLKYVKRKDVHRNIVERWQYGDGRIYSGCKIVAWMPMPKPLAIFENEK